MDIATAAVKLAHAASGADGEGEEQDIPAPVLSQQRAGRAERGDRPVRVGTGRRADEGTPRERQRRAQRGPRRGRPTEWDVTRVYIGAGRKAGVRPADLVGAIANEVGIDSGAIGAIEIADRFSLVEVPEEIVEDVIGALRSTTIKGKRVTVRRDRDAGEVDAAPSPRPAGGSRARSR
jgi:ATP-dependent RNA helicase DeaD